MHFGRECEKMSPSFLCNGALLLANGNGPAKGMSRIFNLLPSVRAPSGEIPAPKLLSCARARDSIWPHLRGAMAMACCNWLVNRSSAATSRAHLIFNFLPSARLVSSCFCSGVAVRWFAQLGAGGERRVGRHLNGRQKAKRKNKRKREREREQQK